MSVREAKGRLLSREYMADREFMTEYAPDEREWYLLTALFADDAGFLPWNLTENAANLYRYVTITKRERNVAAFVAHFAATGRFVDFGCGHALLPRVARRPRGMKREFSVQEEHSHCSGTAQLSSFSTQTLLSTAQKSSAEQSASSPVLSIPVQSSPIVDASSPRRLGDIASEVGGIVATFAAKNRGAT